MKFLKEFITVNRKFKPRFEFILNLHSCNHSAIEIIEAPALLWKRSKKHKPQSRKVTLLISFLGFVQLDILISLAGWTGGREREGSCCHYGGITARQPWCDGWAHSSFLLSPLIHSTDLWNPTKHQKLNSEVWVWKPSGKPPHSPPLVSSREGSHSFFLKSFHC